MSDTVNGIFGFSIPEIYLIAELLGFSQGLYSGVKYEDKTLKEIISLQLPVIAAYGNNIPTVNLRNIDINKLIVKINKITEKDLREIKDRFNVYASLSIFSWESGVPIKRPEIDRLKKAGLVFETEEIAA